MARTDNPWDNSGGTYIKTISPIGFDILINGTNKYLNFNTISGSSGYGFRDNNGIIEFKNFNSSWLGIDTAVWGKISGNLSDQTDLQDALDLKWSISGNTIGAKKTLGSIDNQDFGIITNNTERLTVLKGGNVGIGKTSPTAKLDIAGNFNLDNTTHSNQFGVITKNGARFIHDFNFGDNGTVTTNGYNTFVGLNAGNFAMGSTATLPGQASYNSALGYNALYNNTTGSNNSVLGYGALRNNTTGNYNSALGVGALYTNTTGSNNSALGYNALYNNTTGSNNSALGYGALYLNTTGYNNSALGFFAGRYIADGSTNQTSNNSTYLGVSTKALADGDTNETVIGYNTTGAGSNSVALGNDSVTKTILKGNVGIGTTTPSFGSITGKGLEIEDTTNIPGIRIQGPATGALELYHNNGLSVIDSRTAAGGSAIAFNTEGGERMRIISTGNVGIGTTTPAYKLDVNGEIKANNLRIPNTSDGGITDVSSTAWIYPRNASNNLHIRTSSGGIFIDTNNDVNFRKTDGTNLVKILSTSGNVGIGTTTPSTKLQVNGVITKGSENSIVPGIAFTQIADRTIGNTTTETSMFTTGVGSLTIPANSLVQGRTYRIKLKGYASGVNGDTSTIKVKLGTTELVSSTGSWQTLTDIGFTLEFDFTCRTTGVTGTVAGNGFSLVSGGQGFSTVSMRSLLAGTDTLNTTVGQTIDLTYQWSAANTGNTITITNASVEVLN